MPDPDLTGLKEAAGEILAREPNLKNAALRGGGTGPIWVLTQNDMAALQSQAEQLAEAREALRQARPYVCGVTEATCDLVDRIDAMIGAVPVTRRATLGKGGGHE